MESVLAPELAVNLHGLELNGPALIIETPQGVTYRTQVGGVGCFQVEVKGVLLPLRHSRSPYLNPLWWAEVRDTLAGRRTVEMTMQQMEQLEYSASEIERVLRWCHGPALSREEIFERIAQEIERLAGERIRNLEVLHPDDCQVCAAMGPFDHEAWLRCRFEIDIAEPGAQSHYVEASGYITWPNSD